MANNIVEGEHDWMKRFPTANPGMGFPGPAPARGPGLLDRIGGAMFGGDQAYGGLLGAQEQHAAKRQAMMAMASQLMAAGGESPTRVSFGQALGPALMAGQQAQRQYGNDMLQAMLLKTKLQTAGQTTAQKDYQYAVANGYKGTFEDWKRTGTKASSGVQEYEYAKAGGYKGTFEDWKRVASSQPQAPSAIQEYEYYNKLPTQQEKDTYLTIKRSMQPYQLGEAGGGKVVFNRATGQYEQVTTAAEEAAGAGQIAAGTAGAKLTGEATAEAKLDLPRLEQNTSQALETIGQLKSHPGLPYITGAYSMAPIVPGTPQAGADALAKQIQGKTFLEAFTTLKGSGQITEVEGTKAEAAIARLQRSQSRREYIQALNELEGVLNVGLERSRRKASGGQESQTTSTKRIRVDANGDPL